MIPHRILELGGPRFLIRWENLGPGEQGLPYDAGGAELLSCQGVLRLEGLTRAELFAGNAVDPNHAVVVAQLFDKGPASLITSPIQARWYFPKAMAGNNTGSLDIILLFQRT